LTRVADAHTDLLLELSYREHRLGETDVFARTWLPLLEQGGVELQVCPVFVELEKQPESALREALGQVVSFRRACRETADRVVAIRSGADLDMVVAGERIGLLLALEGVEAFGYETWPAEVFHGLGVRMAGLTWNRRNPFADGVAENDDGGLSRLGRSLVDRLVELGVVIDLAHASPRTFADVLERAGGAPVLVSHAACRAIHEHPRNLTDSQLRALADAGGVLGLMLHPLVIGPDRRTIGAAAEHLEHAASVMGIERLALGGDFLKRLAGVKPVIPVPDSLSPNDADLDAGIEGLEGPECYPALANALRARGWSESDVTAVMGANLVRFLRHALA
jgi:membrane dipeptidase